MKIYVAHNFAARDRLRGVLVPLQVRHEVTSRWIYDDSHLAKGLSAESARDDVDDIERADALLIFVDQFGERPGKGKFWEWGFAFGLGKEIIIVGEDSACIFFHLHDPLIRRFTTFHEALAYLSPEPKC